MRDILLQKVALDIRAFVEHLRIMSAPVFIYCLKDPTTGDVRYIGKTGFLRKRLQKHLIDSLKVKSHLGNWLRSLCGEKPLMVVLHEVSKNETWQEEERRYISCARAMGVNLVNSTDGGEGASGPKSPEHRAALSAALKGVPSKPKTLEWRAALSAAHKGVLKGPHSPEHKAAQSLALKGVPWSAKRRAAFERGNA